MMCESVHNALSVGYCIVPIKLTMDARSSKGHEFPDEVSPQAIESSSVVYTRPENGRRWLQASGESKIQLSFIMTSHSGHNLVFFNLSRLSGHYSSL